MGKTACTIYTPAVYGVCEKCDEPGIDHCWKGDYSAY
jgi:hypothetical protein